MYQDRDYTLLNYRRHYTLKALHTQGYELRVSRRLGRDGWAQRRGLSLTTPPAARVARGGALGGFWVSPRRRPLRALGWAGSAFALRVDLRCCARDGCVGCAWGIDSRLSAVHVARETDDFR